MKRPKRIPKPCPVPGCTVKDARYGGKTARTCARHSKLAMIEFTPAQAEWVRWALEGPISDWDDVERLMWEHGIDEAPAHRAILDRDLCHWHEGSSGRDCWFLGFVDPAGEFIAALLNMLEDVAPDVADGYGRDEATVQHGDNAARVITARRKAAAINAARKIRDALGLLR